MRKSLGQWDLAKLFKVQIPDGLLKDILLLILKIIAVVLVFIFIFSLMFGIVRYKDSSMIPAIKEKDIAFFYRYRDGYIAGDVIVLRYEGKVQLRRIIAVEDDIVDITDAGLKLNGSLQQEWGIYQETGRFNEGIEFPVKVPKGYVFVMGDNREEAVDSRVYGCVKIKDTLGRVITVFRGKKL